MIQNQTTEVVGASATTLLGIMTVLGLESGPVFWALVGAAIGMSLATTVSKSRAVVVFVAVVLSCSLLGSWAAQHWLTGEALSRNACACLLAMVFHPLLNTLVTQAPALVVALVRKWFGLGGEAK